MGVRSRSRIEDTMWAAAGGAVVVCVAYQRWLELVLVLALAPGLVILFQRWVAARRRAKMIPCPACGGTVRVAVHCGGCNGEGWFRGVPAVVPSSWQ